MKKNVLWMTILMAVMSLSAMAQNIKADSLTKIPLGSRVDFTMDFSKATIHDRSESDFAKYEPDWEKDKPSIVDRFRSAANLVLDKDLKFGDYPEADYQIVITVKSITTSGFITCDVLLTNKAGATFFKAENVKGNSDSFFTPGTKLARMKVWAALTGGALGKMMKSRL